MILATFKLVFGQRLMCIEANGHVFKPAQSSWNAEPRNNAAAKSKSDQYDSAYNNSGFLNNMTIPFLHDFVYVRIPKDGRHHQSY